MSAFALAWRNLRKQRRRTLLMGAVVAFGFAAVALAGGFIAQSFDTLKDGTIRSVGQLQIVDRRSLHATEETTRALVLTCNQAIVGSVPAEEANYNSGDDFLVEFLGYRFSFSAAERTASPSATSSPPAASAPTRTGCARTASPSARRSSGTTTTRTTGPRATSGVASRACSSWTTPSTPGSRSPRASMTCR